MIRRPLVPLLLMFFLVFELRADTIHLKNGEFIDGVVSLKTSEFVELKIGSAGKIVLPLEEIHTIEKNSRKGGYIPDAYVDLKGKAEKVGAKSRAGKKPGSAKRSSSGKYSLEDEEDEDEDDEDLDGDSEDDLPWVQKSEIDPELRDRIEELVEGLGRQKSRIRVQSERRLEAIGQPAIPFLLPVAGSKNDLTRVAVMRLFHSFGDQQAINVCIKGLLDSNEYVRKYANLSLKRVTGEDFNYRPTSSPRRREQAHQKWVKWWKKEKAILAEDRRLAEMAR